MNRRNWVSTVLVLCLGTASCFTGPVRSPPTADVEAPVRRFLEFYFDDYRRGLPERRQLPQLATFLTPEFADLFDAALKGQVCYRRKNNNEGPPPIQGDLFSSLFEGATKATYRPIARTAESAAIEVEWTNDDKHLSPDATVWQDQILLVRTASGWRIADFVHLGDWDFMMKGKVSEILRSVARECAG